MNPVTATISSFRNSAAPVPVNYIPHGREGRDLFSGPCHDTNHENQARTMWQTIWFEASVTLVSYLLQYSCHRPLYLLQGAVAKLMYSTMKVSYLRHIRKCWSYEINAFWDYLDALVQVRPLSRIMWQTNGTFFVSQPARTACPVACKKEINCDHFTRVSD